MRKFFQTYRGLILYGAGAGFVLGIMKYLDNHSLVSLFAWSILFAVLIAAAAFCASMLLRNVEIPSKVTIDRKVVVRIKACNFPFAWYYGHDGELFEVVDFDKELYITKGRSPEGYIRREDCEVVL